MDSERARERKRESEKERERDVKYGSIFIFIMILLLKPKYFTRIQSSQSIMYSSYIMGTLPLSP